MQEQRADERRQRRREAPRRRLLAPVRTQQPGTRRGGVRPRLERRVQRGRRARQQLGVLVEQQAVAPARALQQLGVVLALAAPPLARHELRGGRVVARGRGRAVA
jgi:hypothetical protein